jgi:hypothetical protein
LILLTPHLCGLDYELDQGRPSLDQGSNYPHKMIFFFFAIFISTADTADLFGKIWIAHDQGLPIMNTSLK